MPILPDKTAPRDLTAATDPKSPIKLHFSPAGAGQCYLVASVNRPMDPARACLEIYGQIESFLHQEGLQVVHERIFGSGQCYPAIMAARTQALRDSDPIRAALLTYIQGKPLWGDGLAGLQIRAVRVGPDGGEISPVLDDGQPCGRRWNRNGTSYLMLQNLNGLAASAPEKPDRRTQAEEMFNRACRILQAQGSTFSQVARTWIYLSKILDWYGEFNQVRNAKYRDYGLMPPRTQPESSTQSVPPASTGIQGENPMGAEIVSDLLAILPRAGHAPRVEFIGNTRQKDAFRYGAAFSRGTLIQEPDLAQLQISGTAAIDEQGHSLFPNDMSSQVNRTLDNLEALMRPAGASFDKIVSATIFLKRPEDASLYWQIAAQRGLERLPAVYMVADICRPELLFEFDAEAAW
jgi:enamine deaminase RidA (YjgF/YER057c/UK114 family)